MVILGLRVGGSNTSACVAQREDGRVVPVQFHDGCCGLLASAVGFAEDGRTVVGQRALQLEVIDPSSVVVGFVRKLGQYASLGSPLPAPEELTSRLVQVVRDAAERTVESEVRHCVVCAPGYFQQGQLDLLLKAVKAAGLNVLMLIPDPMAAVIGAGLTETGRWAAVLRMGGYGFDVAILRRHSPWEIVAQDGDAFLGGNTVDEALANWFLGNQSPAVSKQVRHDRRRFLRVLREAEEVKIRLSGNRSCATMAPEVGAGELMIPQKIRRDELEQLARPIREHAVDILQRCLLDAGLHARHIDAFLLAGGSARLPLLRELIEERCEVAVATPVEPELLCAKGAALAGANLHAASSPRRCDSGGEAGQPDRRDPASAHIPAHPRICVRLPDGGRHLLLPGHFGGSTRLPPQSIPDEEWQSPCQFHVSNCAPSPIYLGLPDGGRHCILPANTPLPCSTSLNFRLPGDSIGEVRLPLYWGETLVRSLRWSLPVRLPKGAHMRLDIRIPDLERIRIEGEVPDAEGVPYQIQFDGSIVSEDMTPSRLDENVQFTVYRPQVVQPARWYPMLAFAHLAERRPDAQKDEPDPVGEVARQANQVLGEQVKEYHDVTQDSRQAMPREGEITFVPNMPGIEFNPRRRSFCWLESVHREEFRFQAATELDGKTARGRFTIFLGSIIVADIPLAIRVDSRSAREQMRPAVESSSKALYRKVFASYSHKDSWIVDEFENYALAVGDRYLRDVRDLRTGEIWSARLEHFIEDADIFQLFWSRNSMRSRFVRQEWEHALGLGRENFIRPTYWEEPLPNVPEEGLPPDELRRLHFQRIYVPKGARSRMPLETSSTRKEGQLVGILETAATSLGSEGPMPGTPPSALVAERKWFFIRDGLEHGPLSADELRRAAETGLLRRDDPVWWSGHVDRLAARDVADLFPGTSTPQSHAAVEADGEMASTDTPVGRAPATSERAQRPSGAGAGAATCPYCFHRVEHEDVLFIARHADLLGDAVLGPNEHVRFRPSRFTPDGHAIDSGGMTCTDVACPFCHMRLPGSLLTMPSCTLSVLGYPGSGKSSLLTSVFLRLRTVLPRDFGVRLSDANASTDESEYRNCTYKEAWLDRGRTTLPKPFMFNIQSDSRPVDAPGPSQPVSQNVILYESGGVHCMPGADPLGTPEFTHLAHAEAVLFLFDPTYEPSLQRFMRSRPEEHLVEGQVALLTNMINLVRRGRGLEAGQKYTGPVVIVLSKADLLDVLPPECMEEEPWVWDETTHAHLVDLGRVMQASFTVRCLMDENVPELVHAAETFASDVIFVPVTACGLRALDAIGRDGKREDGIPPTCSAAMAPRWVEVPILYVLYRLGCIRGRAAHDSTHPVPSEYQVQGDFFHFVVPGTSAQLRLPLTYADVSLRWPRTGKWFRVPVGPQ